MDKYFKLILIIFLVIIGICIISFISYVSWCYDLYIHNRIDKIFWWTLGDLK